MPGKWGQFSEEQKDALLESLEGLYNDPEMGPGIQEAVEKNSVSLIRGSRPHVDTAKKPTIFGLKPVA